MSIFKGISELSMNGKIALGLKTSVFVICAILALRGHPPAHAQQFDDVPKIQHEPINNEDEQQDLTLMQMHEWHNYQIDQNRVFSDEIKLMETQQLGLRSDIDDTRGQAKGWFGLLTFLTGVSVFFQLKKSSKTG